MIVVGRLVKVTADPLNSEASGRNSIDDTDSESGLQYFYDPLPSVDTPENWTQWPPIFHADDDGQGDNSTTDTPPERLTVDYVEMAILVVMVLVGGPLNFVSLIRSIKADPSLRQLTIFRCFGCDDTQSSPIGKAVRSFNLKVHLTVANMLVIWVYALSDLCWLGTYSWRGGDFMCRVVRFVHAFCFYATSNLVSTIAIQRLSVAMRLDRPASRRRASSNPAGRSYATRARNGNCKMELAYGAWALAFLCSVPQLVIWRTFELYPGWHQCVTMWTVTAYTIEHGGEENGGVETATLEFQEKIYNGLHLAFVFWIPVQIIVCCYVLIVTRFHRKIRKQALQIAAEATAEAENRAAHVRASLVFGGPVDAGSPLLLPIAVYRALKYQTMETTDRRASARGSITDCRRRTVVLHRPRQNRFCFPCCYRKNRWPTARVDSLPTEDQPGASAASILNATLIGTGRPYLRKSFAMSTLSRAKKRTMKKTVWILLSYLLCWTPYNVLVLWRYVNRNVDFYDFEIMYNLIVLNAVVNPLIYGI